VGDENEKGQQPLHKKQISEKEEEYIVNEDHLSIEAK
jgi:hypothetical protein